MSNTEGTKSIEILVVDSSVLIKRAPVKDLTDKVYAVPGVVAEIKDENTRASLQVLPYEFKLKEPNSDSIKFVTSFSRRTGDLANLSQVDLHLIALTYQLCKENMLEEEFNQLRTEPPKNIQPLINANELKLDKQVNVAGFYLPPKTNKNDTKKENENDKNANSDTNNDTSETNQDESINKSKSESNEDEDEDEELSTNLETNLSLNDENNNVNNCENSENNQEEVNQDDEDDDEAGWITPSNLNEIQKQSIIDSDKQEITNLNFKVACMTSDFSMQNVLIQIGIPVLSVDGLLIKKPRSYVLRCITCYKTTTNMLKQFCPHCGYKTLERVVVTVDADGNRIYRGRRKPISTKGLRYSLPTPRGGKHPNYPILSEDQPQAHNFPSKRSLVKNNPLDPDYVCQSSPFAIKDVYSRSAALGIRGDSRKSTNRFSKRK